MEGWNRLRLDEFVKFQRGFDLPKDKFIPGDVPVYGSTSVLGYHNDAKVNAPGVITGRSGTLGKFQYSVVDFWPHNTSLWVKDFKGNNPKFAFYLMQCLDFADFNSGGAVPTLNRNVLRSFKVDVPPFSIQCKIAKILSAYDNLIENNIKRIKLLEEMAQIAYEEWFVRFKFPGHETTVFDKETGLPEGWKKGKLDKLCTKITDGTHDSPKQTEIGYKLVTGKHILDGFIDFETAYTISKEDHIAIRKRSGLIKGDILFSNIGTLGNVAMVVQDFEFSCKNVIIFKYKKGFSNFLYTYLSSRYTKKKLVSQSSGVAQKFYSLKLIRNLQDNFASKDLIIAFDDYVGKLYKSKYNLYNQNQRLKEARDILLPRLMTGMIDVEKI